MGKVLLKGGSLIDEKGNVHVGCDLLAEDGRIAAIGAHQASDGCEVVDCTGRYITPGLPVLHAHSPMHILRGLAEDVHIDDWFNTEIFPYESKLTPDDIYWGARLCMAEMLDCGVTAFADHYFGAELVARAANDSGIRCDIAVTAFAGGGDATADIAETRRLLKLFEGNDRIHIRYGPHSPYLVAPNALHAIVEAAHADGVGIHLHVSETAEQVRASFSGHNKSPFAVCAEAGCFTIPCIVAHGLWVEDGDVSLTGKDTYIAASPKTYLKLGMGTGNLWRLRHGLNLCVGTDGAASSNSVNPIEQLMLFGLLGKAEDHAADYTVTELWQMLMNGHNALCFDSGRLAVDAVADLNVWELDTIATAPAYNPLAAIIYSSHPKTNIRHTMVGGRFVKRDGVLLQDVNALLGAVRDSAAGIINRGKGVAHQSF